MILKFVIAYLRKFKNQKKNLKQVITRIFENEPT